MIEFRLFLREECLINDSPGPSQPERTGIGAALLGLFVPKLLETVITGLGNALKKAGGDYTKHLTAEAFEDLYVADDNQALYLNQELGSVLGVWFDPEKDSPPGDELATKLKEEGILPGKAKLVGAYEGLIRSKGGGTAFFLDTRHFSIRDFISRRARDERAYVVTLSLSTPDAKPEGSTVAVGRINLGRCRKGDSLVPDGHPLDDYPRYWSNLMPWPGISGASRARHDREVTAKEAARNRYMPVTFSLTISETTDGRRFLVKLGELLAESAEKASTEISNRILPAEREKTAADEAARAETLYREELEAQLAVLEAKKALKLGDPEDKPALEVKLTLARQALEWKTRLRKAAGLPDREADPEDPQDSP